MSMNWIYLLVAGLFEVGFTTSLKLSEGFTKLVPTTVFCVFSLLSFWCLNKAIASIPLGVAYAVWTGIGAAGTACVGMLVFGDQLTMWKLFFLFALVGSVFGLKVLS